MIGGLGDLERGSSYIPQEEDGLPRQDHQRKQHPRMMSYSEDTLPKADSHSPHRKAKWWPSAKKILTARDVIERGCYSDDDGEESDDDWADTDTEKDHSVVSIGREDEQEDGPIITMKQFLEEQGHEVESDNDGRRQPAHAVISIPDVEAHSHRSGSSLSDFSLEEDGSTII